MSEPPPSGAWAGCHGIRLAGWHDAAAWFGTATGEPFLDATLVDGPAGPPGERLVWRLEGEVALPDGPVVEVDQSLTRRPDGTFHLRGPGGAALAVDVAGRTIVVDGEHGPVAAQLVVTIGLPLLLHAAGVLVFHASCAADDHGGVLVAAPSGTGKSTLLVGLVDAGWRAVSEDLCAVDLRAAHPQVWPGPPWVRRAGEGPRGAAIRFRTPDKTAYDIAPQQVAGPVPLRAIVLLEAPGGDEVAARPLSAPEALAVLARHAIWLGEPDGRAPTVFGPCVAVTGAVPTTALRAPIGAGWVELVAPHL